MRKREKNRSRILKTLVLLWRNQWCRKQRIVLWAYSNINSRRMNQWCRKQQSSYGLTATAILGGVLETANLLYDTRECLVRTFILSLSLVIGLKSLSFVKFQRVLTIMLQLLQLA
ncbi:hypothetical protein MTR67_039115 [Solanum verrucosum]|uniref:Uncharacterized protein n=1 Tax=Solanum verrucosum TaxID=315347 RepID=A0AAF0UGD0_SOLVR|nr:hypothetical protein MTR67_039115 [Solanum verrucosum]